MTGAKIASKPPPPPRGAFTTIDGRRLHVVRAGPKDTSGPLVVLEAGSFGFSPDRAGGEGKVAGARRPPPGLGPRRPRPVRSWPAAPRQPGHRLRSGKAAGGGGGDWP